MIVVHGRGRAAARRRPPWALAVLHLLLAACGAAGPGPISTPAHPQVTPIELATLPPATDSEAAMLIPELPDFTVGRPEVLYSSAQRETLGLSTWPQGSIAALPRGDGTFTYYAANGPDTARTIGPLANPAEQVSSTGIPLAGANPEYTSAAGGSLYRDAASGLLLMFYRAQYNRPQTPNRTYSLIGLAVSNDDGHTFQDLGPIVRPEFERGQPGPQPIEIGSGTHAVVDGHFYLYFKDYSTEGRPNYLAVARAPAEPVVQAALEGMTIAWGKYYQGSFSQPALGGKSSPLELGNPALGWVGVSYNTYLDRYLMVISQAAGPDSLFENLFLVASPDGIHWSPRARVTSDAVENGFPSIIGGADLAGETGRRTFIYSTRSQLGGDSRWQDAELVRREITLHGLIEPPNQ